jgi:hypothetical protein
MPDSVLTFGITGCQFVYRLGQVVQSARHVFLLFYSFWRVEVMQIVS